MYDISLQCTPTDVDTKFQALGPNTPVLLLTSSLITCSIHEIGDLLLWCSWPPPTVTILCFIHA